MSKVETNISKREENNYLIHEIEVLNKLGNLIPRKVKKILTNTRLYFIQKELVIKVKKILTNTYLRFVLKKLVFYAFLVFIAVSLAFFIPRFVPGDPLNSIISPPIGATPEQIEQWFKVRANLIRYLGLDKPLWEQFLSFWGEFLKFNLGESFSWHFTPVFEIVLTYLPYTLALVIPALLISFFLGNWIGARIGFQKKKRSTFVYYLFIFFQSAPYFWVSLIFFDIFILKLRIVPFIPTPDIIFDPSVILVLLQQYWLPLFTLVLTFTGGWATGMRSMVIYELDSDYLLFCRKLGFNEKRLRRYATRNAILPQYTGLNLRFNELVGATLIVEWLFLWPGLGSLTYNAFMSYDYPLIIGTFIITILVIAVGNFLIDITYSFIDPRIKTGSKEG
ncbi:MAG: ABC transporter permease [Candidatus Hodarchaeota archaeon]